jgi:hypothetical protein
MEFLDKLLKTAEGVTKQLAPVEHDENNEYAAWLKVSGKTLFHDLFLALCCHRVNYGKI